MLRRALLFLTLVVPSTLAAQSPTATPPVDPVMFQFVRIADIFGSRLVAAFDSIPAARYDYSPTPIQQTIGYIAQHLERANYGLCARLGAPKHVGSAKDSLADTIKARWPKDTLVARLEASLRYCDAALEGMGQLTSPAQAATLLGFETDLAEHYSQLSGYMRQLGLVPPSALPAPRRTAIALPPSSLAQYVGRYQVTPGFELDVTVGDRGLSVTSSMGGPAATLLPESVDVFFVEAVDAQLTFTRNASGAVTGLLLHQYGRDRRASRIR